MGKVVVYIKAPDEKRLKARGLDPAEWVRELVKKALAEQNRVFPEQPDRREIRPDFRGKDLK